MEFEVTVNDTIYLMTDAEGGVCFSRKDREVLLEPDFEAIIEATFRYSMMNPGIGQFKIQTHSRDIGRITSIFIPTSDEGIVINPSDVVRIIRYLEALQFLMNVEGESFLPPQPVKKPSLVERISAAWRRFWKWLKTW
jgi:hypothetical protein